jgi:metal-sulfur cluster biosynthetic enzyme
MEPRPAAAPTEERIREALCTVDDPEVGMNIVDLGLVYRIDVAPACVRIEITMTTPACPMGDLISENARRAVRAALPEGVAVDVALVWEPPWTPDMMSESARQTFGWPR